MTLDDTTTALAAVGVTLAPSAFLFSNDPAHSRPWNPDWVTHRVCDLAKAAGVDLDIKGIRHYTASQLLAAGFDLESGRATVAKGGERSPRRCLRLDGEAASVSCIRSSPMQPRDSRRVPKLTRRGPFSNDACRGIGSRRARFRSAWWCHR